MLLYEIIAAGLIFVTLVLCTLAPYCYLLSSSRNEARHNSLLSVANCLACGIFLSTCFLGLLPHVRHQEMVLRGTNGTGNSKEPSQSQAFLSPMITTESVVLLGFLLILLIEQAVAMCSSSSSANSPQHSGHHSHSRLATSCDANGNDPVKRLPTLRNLLERSDDVTGGDEDGLPLVDTSLLDDEDEQDIVFRSGSPGMQTGSGMHGHSHSLPLSSEGLTARTLFLFLGLSIHSLFEGIALGVQKERSDFINVLIAIMFHEVLCCVAYGVSMAQQRTSTRAALPTVLILSATIPAGMLIAIIVDQVDTANTNVVRFVLEGLAAGTFVYVACVEMLAAELAGHGHHSEHSQFHESHSSRPPSKYEGLSKAIAVSIGVALFWGMQQLIGKDHSK
ncbi:hypothetical protein WR25_18368 [Diploscapter pachys]|uniref:Zinc/iron permease n=1 Tax=Diploscapter pachys TaxID=2018661 RepID=A0A2A2JZ91_9BILA|nr:hypothetical protein WR25_18368 [Diploscapter pachys]